MTRSRRSYDRAFNAKLVHRRNQRIHRRPDACDPARMAQTVSIIIDSEDRARLAAVIEDRNSPQKHVQRARIVVLSADRLPVLEVARQIGGSRPAVWRWQVRYAEHGIDGLRGGA